MANVAEVNIKQVPVTDEAYPKLLALRDAYLRQPLGIKFTPDELELDRRSWHFAAFDGESVIGCVVLSPTMSAKVLKLRQMVVAQMAQKMGLGKRLVQHCINFAKENGFNEIFLYAREDAVEFYEKQGFKAEGEPFDILGIPSTKMRLLMP